MSVREILTLSFQTAHQIQNGNSAERKQARKTIKGLDKLEREVLSAILNNPENPQHLLGAKNYYSQVIQKLDGTAPADTRTKTLYAKISRAFQNRHNWYGHDKRISSRKLLKQISKAEKDCPVFSGTFDQNQKKLEITPLTNEVFDAFIKASKVDLSRVAMRDPIRWHKLAANLTARKDCTKEIKKKIKTINGALKETLLKLKGTPNTFLDNEDAVNHILQYLPSDDDKSLEIMQILTSGYKKKKNALFGQTLNPAAVAKWVNTQKISLLDLPPENFRALVPLLSCFNVSDHVKFKHNRPLNTTGWNFKAIKPEELLLGHLDSSRMNFISQLKENNRLPGIKTFCLRHHQESPKKLEFLSSMTGLKTYIVSGTDNSQLKDSWLDLPPSLETLILDTIPLDAAGLKKIGALPALSFLAILNSTTFIESPELAELQNLRLKTLNLPGCNIFSPGYFANDGWEPFLHSLESLNLDRTQLTENPRNAFILQCDQLNSLSIRGTKPGLQFLRNLKALPLKSLDIGFINVVGWEQAVKKLKTLEVLNVDGIVYQDDILKSLSSLSHLKKLNMNNNNLLTDAALVPIGDHLQHLTVLSIKGCPQITDAGVTALKTKLPNLTILR